MTRSSAILTAVDYGWHLTVAVGLVTCSVLTGCGSGRHSLPIDEVAVEGNLVGVKDHCHDGARLDADVNEETIRLEFSVEAENGGDCGNCSVVELEDEVGDRTVVDVKTGDPLQTDGACPDDPLFSAAAADNPPDPAQPIVLERRPMSDSEYDRIDDDGEGGVLDCDDYGTDHWEYGDLVASPTTPTTREAALESAIVEFNEAGWRTLIVVLGDLDIGAWRPAALTTC